MRALEVFGFKHYLSGPSDHPVDAPDGMSESMLLSGISHNIFIWVLLRDDWYVLLQLFHTGMYLYIPVHICTYKYYVPKTLISYYWSGFQMRY